VHFFGPILRYDLVCTARRTRYFVMRFFYALILFLILYIFYIMKLKSITVEKVAQKQLIDFAELFSYIYLLVQYLLVLMLTPAYVGSAIAEEKERRTLEFLLATDLRNQEIIFGKFASRIGNLLMFLLAGLPVLTFVLFFGGVDPELLKNGFLATFVTVLSISAVSIYCSVHAKTSRDGIMKSYLCVVGYFLFGFILWSIVLMLNGTFSGLASTAQTFDDHDPVLKGLCYFSEYYLTGDIFHAIYLYVANVKMPFLGIKSWSGVDLGVSMNALLRNYLIFHGTLTVCCLLYSVLRMRAIYLKQRYGEGKPSRRQVKLARTQQASDVSQPDRRQHDPQMPRTMRVKLGDWPPVVWKEVFVPRLALRTLHARVLTGLTWGVFLLPAVILFFYFAKHWDQFTQAYFWYIRIAGTVVLCLMLAAVAIRASHAICIEKDKQTLETLLSTSLTDREIVFGKWVGAVLGFGPTVYLISLIWLVGLMTGTLAWSSLLFLTGAYLVYASFAASLGLYFSAGASTTTRSLMVTLFWLVMWIGGHWLIVGPLMMVTIGNDMREVLYFILGMTPCLVLGFLTSPASWSRLGDTQGAIDIQYVWIGLVVTSLLAVLFFLLARQRFYLNTGRLNKQEGMY
jgi:ABC-type Na+ efflux pump permease subunit